MSEPYLGQLMAVGFSFNNRGWSNCDGQLLPIANYSALFSLFGTMYGGDGRTTFGLPELRGRVPIHTGQGPGLPNFQQGSKGGSVSEVLNITQIPSHGHNLIPGTNANQVSAQLVGVNTLGDQRTPGGNALAGDLTGDKIYKSGETPNANLTSGSVSVTGSTALNGGNQSHNNLQPYQTLRWLVALQGLFPSRN